jgi:hypothetical protein
MALKKSELYSSLWSSCDELRGGIEASQYKDHVLVLLFIKYVSDKYAGVSDSKSFIPSFTTRRCWQNKLQYPRHSVLSGAAQRPAALKSDWWVDGTCHRCLGVSRQTQGVAVKFLERVNCCN